MLSWERRHLDELWYHKKTSGATGGGAAIRDCLLLEADTGAGTDELLLEDGSGCLLLERDGAAPAPPGSFVLLQSDFGSGNILLLLEDSSGLELEDSV